MDTAVLRAFLDDIRANPLDDAARLILADWLEDHAETEAERARGRFLRLCASQESELPVEALALLHEHGGAWLGSLPECKGVTAAWPMGLVELVGDVGYFLSAQFTEFAASPAWAWVTGLRLTAGNPAFGQLWTRPWLRGLSRLTFASERGFLPPRFWSFLGSPYLECLRWLDLSDRTLPEASVTALARWPGLGRLHLLNLAGNCIDSSGAEALAGAPSLAELRVLDLEGCRIGSLGLQSLAWRGCFGQLRRLDLAGNGLDGNGLEALAGAPLVATLERLDLDNNDVEDVRVLARMELPALRELSLRECCMSPSAVADLAPAPWLPRLRLLDLEGNGLNDKDLRVLRDITGDNLRIDL